MRSIKARVRKVIAKKPFLGDILCLSEAITGQDFCERRIAIVFNEVVPEDDYAPSEKRAILRDLYRRTKPTVACMKSG